MQNPQHRADSLLGIHIGQRSVYSAHIHPDGRPLNRSTQTYREDQDKAKGLTALVEVEEARARESGSILSVVCLAMDLPDWRTYGSDLFRAWNSRFPFPTLVVPSRAAVLLGAFPQRAAFITILGAELRFVALDVSLTFRDVRWHEGGGHWWLEEFHRLGPHSQRLQQSLSSLETKAVGKRLQAVPKILELADYPGPDPVLKARLDKIGLALAERCAVVASRLPGVVRYSLAGYLSQSVLGQRLRRELEKLPGSPVFHSPHFPPEVGAAALAWSFWSENRERKMLDRPDLFLELTQKNVGKWGPPKTLVRRLYRAPRLFPNYRKPEEL